jgi:hypothetical protein
LQVQQQVQLQQHQHQHQQHQHQQHQQQQQELNAEQMKQLQLQSEGSTTVALLESGTVVYTLFAVKGSQKWYLGFITQAHANDTYDIHYSDGEIYLIAILHVHL